MKNRLISAKARAAVIAVFAVGITVAAWGLYPRAATAQSDSPNDGTPQTTGFMTIGDGETTTCGLLVPAVQSVRNVHFQTMDAHGNLIYGGTLPNDARTAFFDITYHMGSNTEVGFIVVSDGRTGEELGRGPSRDGIVILLVRPGMTRNHKPFGADATYQMFDVDGKTTVHHKFFAIVDRS